MEYPRIITSGDTAIVVEFEDKIDPSINGEGTSLRTENKRRAYKKWSRNSFNQEFCVNKT